MNVILTTPKEVHMTTTHKPATPLPPLTLKEWKEMQRRWIAYSQLVEALREQVNAFGARCTDETDSPRIARIRALLAELGE